MMNAHGVVDRRWALVLAAALVIGCGDDDGPGIVDGGSDVATDTADGSTPDVPDGNTPDGDPPATCGDGIVNGTEACDTAIESGQPGACPMDCAALAPPMDSCQSYGLTGSECEAQCELVTISDTINGDGCCPSGATFEEDTDCLSPDCGNGVVDAAEFCDIAIAAGEEGACPATCDDGLECTSDVLISGGTCRAACRFDAITVPADGDGCCPSGATSADDMDCSASCGDGVLDSGETCDTDIAAGMTGACPASCDDMDACTSDSLQSGGTCSARCVFTAVTATVAGDMCCPMGATSITDADCMPVCGNGVREAGEECDDGNMIADDTCDLDCNMTMNAPVTGFRLTTMALVDPDIYVDAGGGFCIAGKGFANTQVQNAIDNFVLNSVLTFTPLDDTAPTTPVDAYLETSCDMAGCSLSGPAVSGTASNQSAGMCFTAPPGSRTLSYGTVNDAAASCFSVAIAGITLNLAGAPVTLEDVTLAGTYSGARLTNGVLSGFLTFDNAASTTVDLSGAGLGSYTLDELLQSGRSGDACNTAGLPPTYSDADDRDGDGVDDGWWFFVNVEADVVTLR